MQPANLITIQDRDWGKWGEDELAGHGISVCRARSGLGHVIHMFSADPCVSRLVQMILMVCIASAFPTHNATIPECCKPNNYAPGHASFLPAYDLHVDLHTHRLFVRGGR